MSADTHIHDRNGRLDRSVCGLCGDAYVECSGCGVYLCDCTRAMSADTPGGMCTCPRTDGYRIKRRGCPVHADKDAAYWQTQDAPDTPDVELTDQEREALRFAFVHYHPDHDEGSRAYEVVEALVAARVAEERERANAAVERSFDHAYDYGFDDSEWGEGYRHRDRQVRRALRAALGGEATPRPLPIHRTEAGYPNCSTCDGGGCLDCTDPA